MLSYLQLSSIMDKVQHVQFLYLHVKEPVSDRQHKAAAQNISGAAAGNDGDDLKGMRVLYSILSWLVNREVYCIDFDL